MWVQDKAPSFRKNITKINHCLKVGNSFSIAYFKAKKSNLNQKIHQNCKPPDEGVYNTYVLDTDYDTWGLVMHCAEKKKHPRYLSALLLARKPALADNEISFLRGKLPQDIDKSFMFDIGQGSCDHLMESSQDDPLAYVVNGRQNGREIFKVVNKLGP